MRNITEAEYVKRTQSKKCNCRSTHKPSGRCMYREECETTGVIYKITCKDCGDYYLGKTARSLKIRCQEHYQHVGKFWNKRAAFEKNLGETSHATITAGTPTDPGGGTSVRTTRSSTRANAQQPRTPANSMTPMTGMGHLLSLFSTLRGNINTRTQPTIHEDQSTRDHHIVRCPLHKINILHCTCKT